MFSNAPAAGARFNSLEPPPRSRRRSPCPPSGRRASSSSATRAPRIEPGIGVTFLAGAPRAGRDPGVERAGRRGPGVGLGVSVPGSSARTPVTGSADSRETPAPPHGDSALADAPSAPERKRRPI